MDLMFFGITDIIIVLLFIICFFVGWKKGFLEKFVNIANSIFGLITSIIFCGKFADFIGPKFLNNLIQPKLYDNVLSSSAMGNITNENISTAIDSLLSDMGFPSFLAKYIGQFFSANTTFTTTAELQDYVATMVSTQMTKLVVVVIAFVSLFIGTSILAFILKLIINVLRTGRLFKTIDGILGVVFMTLMFFIVLYVGLLVVSLVMQIPAMSGFNSFMMVDMQLGTEKFRLSKYFYENNIIGNFFKMFF